MGRNFLTQTKIWYNDQFYKVYWLRYNLANYKVLKDHKTIIKNAQQFTITQQALHINQTVNNLYDTYANAMTFDTSVSLEHYLYSYENTLNNMPITFNSKLITITHNNTIVAAGIYDKGLRTIAGIINFYNPDYKKYSLGKMLVLAKLQNALQTGMQYYYPGYIVPGIAKFDYKTFIGEQCTEIWDANVKIWVPYSQYSQQLAF